MPAEKLARAVHSRAAMRVHRQPIEVPLQVLPQQIDGAVAVAGVFPQRHHHDRIEVAAQGMAESLIRDDGARPLGYARADGLRQLVQRSTLEAVWSPSGQQLI